jgi:hypothetical protein
MPLTYHGDVEVAAGVPWTINGTLCNAAGAPFDVTNAQLAWVSQRRQLRGPHDG